LDALLDALEEGSWLEAYQTAEGITSRLEGLRRRLGLPALEQRQRHAWVGALEPRVQSADEALGTLLRDLGERRPLKQG
jgi:hypothetical protein